LAATLLAALVWILRLLARRLIRILAGLSALSILLTYLLGSLCLSSRLLNGRKHMTTEHTVVRSGKLKRKPFNSNVAGHLLIIATFAFSYPRVSSDTPSFAAFTPVAPGVRFNALAIFLTPILCFASDFNSRTSFLAIRVLQLSSSPF